MTHEHGEEQKKVVLENGNASVETGGVSRISAYEVTTWAFRKLISAGKKAPAVPQKALSLISGFGKSGKTHRLDTKIEHYEKELRRLHYKIGKAGISYSGEDNVLETEPVKALIAEVRKKETRIEELKARIIEIKKENANKKRKKVVRREAAETLNSMEIDTIEAAIADAVLFGEFDTPSEMEIFQKVANDLLDNELEVRILAVGELGKIGKEAAVPVLLEASKSDNGDLVSEVVNSLISIGDLRAIPLFLEKASDPAYRVRIGCLRGLYKLADYQDDLPALTEALRDAHPEVRRTAVTFLGWKDRIEAAPALMQCLKDEDRRVRKAAVSALAHLKDESSVLPLMRVLADEELEIREKALQTIRMISGNDEITFDLNADEPALEKAADQMRSWWEKERIDTIHEDRTDDESIETEIIEVETTDDAYETVEKIVQEETDIAPEKETALEESVDESIEEIVGEGLAPEEQAENALDMHRGDETAPEEETAFEESVDESVEEIVGKDLAPEEQAENALDMYRGDETAPEEETAFEESVDESVEEIVGEGLAPEEQAENALDMHRGDETAPEEETAFEESVDESVEEIVGEGLAPEEQAENALDMHRGDETAPEEETAFEESVDESVEEIVGKDLAPEEQAENALDMYRGDETAPEEETAFEESVDESVEEIIGKDLAPEEQAENPPDMHEEGETTPDTTGENDRTYQEEELKKMVKAELLSICHDLEIEADGSLLKSDLIALVLGEKE